MMPVQRARGSSLMLYMQVGAAEGRYIDLMALIPRGPGAAPPLMLFIMQAGGSSRGVDL